MIESHDLDRILGWMQAAGIGELTLRHRKRRLRLQLDSASAAATAPPPEPRQILSPGLGRFLAAHPRRPGIRVEPGTGIVTGQILGYLQTGATLTAITAGQSGTVARILATDGDLLGYGTPVLALEERV
ncbi:MAG TPA: biotin/lipoyl-containing protein [Paracoccaceae bacterium]